MSPVKEPDFFGAGDLLAPPYRDKVLDILASDRAALEKYLDSAERAPSLRFVLYWDDYVRLFRDVRDETVIGEASTDYLWLPGAPRAIRAKVPDARVVFVLRDPAERLQRMYQLGSGGAPTIPFRAWFEAGMNQPPIAESGRYATQLRRFFDAFPADRVRVFLYEDYQANPSGVLRDLLTFLGVRPDHPIDVSRRYNETVTARFPRVHALRRRLFGGASPTRWLPESARRALSSMYRGRASYTMLPADRRMVIDCYRSEIAGAADLLRRDLSAWLR